MVYFCGKFYDIRKLKHIISAIIWTIVGLFVLVIVLLRLPVVQEFIGEKVGEALSERIGSEVRVGRVDIGLFNRVTIDNVMVRDQRGKNMLSASRLSANIDIMPLFEGRVRASSAQVFGLRANLYQVHPDSAYNFQFALDSLSKPSAKPTQLDIAIHSLIVRNGQIRFDRQYIAPRHELNADHLYLSDISGHFILDHLGKSDLSMEVKRLSFKEQSGLDVKSLTFSVEADSTHATIPHIELLLPHSHMVLDDISLNYSPSAKGIDTSTLRYRANMTDVSVTPSDLAFISSKLEGIHQPIAVSMTMDGNREGVNLHGLTISQGDGMLLDADISASNLNDSPAVNGTIHQCRLTANSLSPYTSILNLPPSTMERILALKQVEYEGSVAWSRDRARVTGEIATALGDLTVDMNKQGSKVMCSVLTDGIQAGTLLGKDDLGLVACNLQAEGTWPLTSEVSLKGHFPTVEYQGHAYKNISVDGTYRGGEGRGMLSMDDELGKIDIEGALHTGQNVSGDIRASVSHFQPNAMSLTTSYPGTTFSFDATAKIDRLKKDDFIGSIDVNNFSMTSPTRQLNISNLHIVSDLHGTERMMSIESDIGTARLEGEVHVSTLAQSVKSILADKLPTLPSFGGVKHPQPSNHFTFDANVNSTEWMESLLGMNVQSAAPIHIEGEIDDARSYIALNSKLDDLTYGSHHLIDTRAHISTIADSLVADLSLKRANASGEPIDIDLHATAVNDIVNAQVHIDNHNEQRHLYGILAGSARFFEDSSQQSAMHITMHPTNIFINDEAWQIQPSDIIYSKEQVVIDHLMLTNGSQQIAIDGRVRPNENDSIEIALKDVDVDYMSTFMRTRNIFFGGTASGRAYLTSLYDDPSIHGHVSVTDFTFVGGRMGHLNGTLEWCKSKGMLQFGAIIDNGPFSNTLVNGTVGLSPSLLDIDIQANNTPAGFLNKFCGAFLRNVEGKVNGDIHVVGTFRKPNLTGQATINGTAWVKSLGTQYTLHNDSIVMTIDDIAFRGDTIMDRDGHRAVITGRASHTNLSRFTYDIGIDADHMLVYDFPTFGNNTFCGTVYATGDCTIKGKSGETTIDAVARTEPNTIFRYNADSPDAISKQEFIHWNDITDQAVPTTSDVREVIPGSTKKNAPVSTAHSDLHLNFQINATPDATLRLMMSSGSGDYIDLNGSGTLRANYFNKNGMNIYGNYVVDHGVYKMTIQNIIKKDFTFSEGGTIAFNGNPFDAAIDLKAIHTVNGVTLSDLNLGRNFATNNIRVNCIMNIHGTAGAPLVDFDMEMPTVNADAQQMIRSLMNSEEELNQQVIYLLTIGRFYSQNNNSAAEEGAQSQTSLAMQSLLSGTLSQQINSVLNSVLKNNNWNIGANISTGDEGWNNAEYEGILSGRLLNNRLLINGQFGYRDNANATTSFIGDFDVRYLLLSNGNLAVRVYNQTNDRYFTKNSLNTQGVGLVMKKDFSGWRDFFGLRKKKVKAEKADTLQRDSTAIKRQ